MPGAKNNQEPGSPAPRLQSPLLIDFAAATPGNSVVTDPLTVATFRQTGRVEVPKCGSE